MTTSYPGTRKLITITIKDENDVAHDATLAVFLRTPDGTGPTDITGDVTHDAEVPGIYAVEVECPVAGKYILRAEATGGVVVAGEHSWHITKSLATWDPAP